MGPMENYKKKRIKWVPFHKACGLSGSQLLLHCRGSIALMNSTVINGSHSNVTNFYKWVLWKIINLLSGSHFVTRGCKWVPIPDSLQWVFDK